ncbi:MAG: tyrosine-protein kinase, partial [Pseudomonadales bacterium]|nr:tyrosine-protein kinase [Pseudomonadales bacterium]
MSANQKNSPLSSTVQSSFIDEEVIDLAEYLGVLLAYRWLIALITAVGLVLGAGYAFIATPVYQANALIQVEDSKGSGLGALEDVSSLLEGGDAAVEAEIQLLYSRMVIKSAVDQLSMNTVVEPDYFPLIGRAAARYFSGGAGNVASPWLGLSQYAWGGEKIVIDLFDLPDSWLGEPLQLIVGTAGQYHLEDEDGQLLLKGKVGRLAESSLIGDERIKLFISVLNARPDTHFNIMKQTPIGSVKTVLENFSVKEKGKKSGMLSLTMSGANKASATQLLNKIADVYVGQNISRNSAEAGLSLSFLEKQLPTLKERVDTAENAYNQYRTEHGSADLATETMSVLQGIVEIDAAILELQQERGELRKRFKEAHPVIQAVDENIAILQAEAKKHEENANQLPETQRDILRLARDVEVNTALYTKLLNTSQELRVVEAGTVGNVRIIDYALIPEKPVKPKKAMVIAIATMVSLFLGVVIAFMLRALRGGVNDPDEVEQKLGLPVYASILHSNIQQKQMKLAKKGTDAIGILSVEHPEDSAVESFRSLR